MFVVLLGGSQPPILNSPIKAYFIILFYQTFIAVNSLRLLLFFFCATGD